MGKPNAEPAGLLGVASELLKEVWIDPVMGLQGQQVTRRILDRLGNRTDGRELVRTLARNADDLFGMNVLAAVRLKRIAMDWLKSKGNDQ